jgi:isopentenyldiphosphate isomerase
VGEPAPAGEWVDVVDEHDRVTGSVPRARMRAENLRHRAVFVLVVASDGRVLVHRRSPAKDVWPGWWDLAVGGVVRAGETYDVAVHRELAEELGLVATHPELLSSGTYEDDHVRLVGRVYRLVHDGPFTFADGEVVAAEWVTPAELTERVRRDPYLPDSLALVAPHV